MNYIIILTQVDIEYIDNRAVICSVGENLAIFEPIPEVLQAYFIGRERIPYIPDWAYPTTGRITIPNQIILQDINIRNLITYCDMNNIKYDIFELDTQVYVSFLYQAHYDLLPQYPNIIFEGTIDIVPTTPENQ